MATIQGEVEHDSQKESSELVDSLPPMVNMEAYHCLLIIINQYFAQMQIQMDRKCKNISQQDIDQQEIM